VLGLAASGNAVPPLQAGGAFVDLAPAKDLSTNGEPGSLIRNAYTYGCNQTLQKYVSLMIYIYIYISDICLSEA
jgi:hypothetical protein